MDKGADVHAQQKRHCCLNKDISLHGHVNCTLIYILKIKIFIVTAVVGCAVATC